MLTKEYKAFANAAKQVVPEDRVTTDPLYTLAYGTDASFYRMVPKVVVTVEEEIEVVRLLREAGSRRLPVTFRGAGTSLSGQAVTDAILMRLGASWQGCAIFEDAGKIRLQPGVIGSWANSRLAQFGKKIGPDPASIDTAQIGGIVANNASGMCCGVAQNSYKTLADLRVVLYDGTILDTEDDASRSRFADVHPEILKGLCALRDRVAADRPLAETIRRKFKIKNTMGYSLNALVDFTDPFEILKHLFVGSEGTLGFISSVTYHTVVDHPHKASALLLFPDIQGACKATVILKRQPVAAVELMDRAALRSVAEKEGMPDTIKGLAEGVTALLVETRAESREVLNEQIGAITVALAGLDQVVPFQFTSDPVAFTRLWAIRKGLFPAVGAVREAGTTVIIEDVAFPMDRLAAATLELQGLFKTYRYDEAIIFGHALAGNLHFVFTQAFDDPAETERYRAFMDEVAAMVVTTYGGSLKAEHGTGRNMAPYVEMEWGPEAYRLMKEIKALFDPANLLNPGVILNADPLAHITHLKPMPEADPLVDQCIECGFCEPVCPSGHLTFTPRQRITAWREVKRREKAGRSRKWKRAYRYPAMETCAADGLCALRCPVGINTGSFIKGQRAAATGRLANRTAGLLAGHYAGTTAAIRAGLKGVHLVHTLAGDGVMETLTGQARRLTLNTLPVWNRALLDAAKKMAKRKGKSFNPLKVVYFPSCIARSFGAARQMEDKRPLGEVTRSVLMKAGYDVLLPEGVGGLCCGLPFASKGFPRQAETKAAELEKALLAASRGGEYPVLCDTSPCLCQMKETFASSLSLYEPVGFILEFLQKRLLFHRMEANVAVHATCTTRKLGLEGKLKALAELCATRVVVPENIQCCGFAGDRGFRVPELNQAALAGLKDQVAGCSEGFSTSRTCEIGLTLHGGINYSSILYLVDRCTERIVQTREL